MIFSYLRAIPFLVLSASLLITSVTYAAPPDPDTASNTQGSVEITGFRSAQFGMDETQVRQAIKTDFNIPSKDIAKEQNELEKTAVLVVSVDNLLPNGGRAKISYILGYHTQKLIQVNIGWGITAGKPVPPESLISAANLLGQHFQKKAFKRENVVINAQTPDGRIIVFRGIDQDRRTAMVILDGENRPATDKSSDTPATFKPTSLILSYIKDAQNQDVFQLKPDAF